LIGFDYSAQAREQHAPILQQTDALRHVRGRRYAALIGFKQPL
jgi:hypothetical protein